MAAVDSVRDLDLATVILGGGPGQREGIAWPLRAASKHDLGWSSTFRPCWRHVATTIDIRSTNRLARAPSDMWTDGASPGPIASSGPAYAVGRAAVPGALKNTVRDRSSPSPIPGSRLSRFPAIIRLETWISRMNPAMCRGVVRPAWTCTHGLPPARCPSAGRNPARSRRAKSGLIRAGLSAGDDSFEHCNPPEGSLSPPEWSA